MARSSLSIKVHWVMFKVILESRIVLLISTWEILCMWLQVIQKVKVMHHAEGHIKATEKIPASFTTYHLLVTY